MEFAAVSTLVARELVAFPVPAWHRAERRVRFVLPRRIVWLLVGMLSGAFLAGGWLYSVQHWFVPKRFGEVVAGRVYRSGQLTPWVLSSVIADHRIRAIIDLNGTRQQSSLQLEEERIARELGVRHYRFPLRGNGTGELRNYAEAVRVLSECERRGVPVLVHCTAGVQRTGGVVALYRMFVQRQPAEVAYAELKTYGWRPERDATLMLFLNAHMAELAELLVKNGTIDRIPDHLPRLDEPLTASLSPAASRGNASARRGTLPALAHMAGW